MRTQRIESELKSQIAWIIQSKVADSRIGFVTITNVKLTPDKGTASVYYHMMGPDTSRLLTHKGLQSASGFIISKLGKTLRLRRIPKLKFVWDTAIDDLIKE